MTTYRIQTASQSNEQDLLAILTAAFLSDPAARFMYPGSREYLSCFPEFIRAFGGAAISRGTAHYIEDVPAVALWLPPGVAPDDSALEKLIRRTIPASGQAQLSAVFESMASYHPTEPHWHLPLIGVDPIWQGRGCGAALLAHGLALCDGHQQPAYLEASNSTCISLYRQHGFQPLGEIQIGAWPPIVPMKRLPRPTPAAMSPHIRLSAMESELMAT